MRTLLTALTALMLFATPVVAWDWEDGVDAYKVGDYQKAFRLWEPLPKRGHPCLFHTLNRGLAVPTHPPARPVSRRGHAPAGRGLRPRPVSQHLYLEWGVR